MSKTIQIDQLADTVEKELNDYADDVNDAVKEAVASAGKEAVKDLKATSPKLTGKYAKSWTVKKVSESSHGLDVVVHNKKYYRLTHLLEHGHAKRGGGRVDAIVHIKPVEEKVTAKVEADIRKEIS